MVLFFLTEIIGPITIIYSVSPLFLILLSYDNSVLESPPIVLGRSFVKSTATDEYINTKGVLLGFSPTPLVTFRPLTFQFLSSFLRVERHVTTLANPNPSHQSDA
jgi:hypothetical protein